MINILFPSINYFIIYMYDKQNLNTTLTYLLINVCKFSFLSVFVVLVKRVLGGGLP